jgi:eukaryotic-like serine/threonine-protein kinase
MKRTLLFLGAAALSAATAFAAGDMLPYENAQAGIKLHYPEEWTKKEGTAGAVVTLVTDKTGGKDTFSENVNVMVQDAGKAADLEGYTRLSVEQLKKMVNAFQLVTLEDAELGGKPAKRIRYTGKDKQGKTMEYFQTWTVDGNRAYLVTYGAEQAEFRRHFDRVIATVRSFQLLGASPRR